MQFEEAAFPSEGSCFGAKATTEEFVRRALIPTENETP